MSFVLPKVILAPMAGVSDVVFRQLCIEQGAQLTYTEMVSAKALSYANVKTAKLLDLAPNEVRVSVQIFGHEPDVMAKQAYWVEQELGEALFALDINMGCPARKIAGKGDGSALMKSPELARDIISSMVREVSSPVTVKFRRGYELDNETAVEFALMAQEAGASAVAVHGRYAQQFYRGKADWDVIARVKAALDIPVIGNGDIVSADSALAMIKHTSCDSVMIGRGAQGNPWIFAEVVAALEGLAPPAKPTPTEKMNLATRHAELLAERVGENLAAMRKHAMWYVAGMKDAAVVRRSINDARTVEDFARIFSVAAYNTEAVRF